MIYYDINFCSAYHAHSANWITLENQGLFVLLYTEKHFLDGHFFFRSPSYDIKLLLLGECTALWGEPEQATVITCIYVAPHPKKLGWAGFTLMRLGKVVFCLMWYLLFKLCNYSLMSMCTRHLAWPVSLLPSLWLIFCTHSSLVSSLLLVWPARPTPLSYSFGTQTQ